jgi:hypothetical protein
MKEGWVYSKKKINDEKDCYNNVDDTGHDGGNGTDREGVTV